MLQGSRSNRCARNPVRFAAPAVLLGAAILLPWPAPAAEGSAPATEAPAAASEPASEEIAEAITVTARKREENLQDVPLSVAAPTEEVLRARGADSLEGVAANVAGFSVQNLGPGQSQVAVRGVSAGQIVRDQPGVKEQVGVYLDESVISLSLFTPDIDLFDMNRVEVLRGPQGTLFGSGSLSGTVRYITNQPRLGSTTSAVEVGGSSIDGGDLGGSAKAYVNVPVGESAAFRVTAYYNALAGYMDAVQPDLSTNEDVNSGSRTGIRAALKVQPNERLSITPRVIYQEVEMDGWNRIDAFNILANPYTTTRPAVRLGEREQFTQFEEPYTDDFLLADLQIEYATDRLAFTSITSYSERDILVIRDATSLGASITGGSIGLPEPVYTLDAPLNDATTVEVITQELRLAGGGDRFEWLVGGFYSTMDRDYGQVVNIAGFEAFTGIPTSGQYGAGPDDLYWSDLNYDFEQRAIFGEATYSFSDRFSLTGGLRWYDFEEDRLQVFDGIFSEPGPNSGSTTADGVAPRLIASFGLSDTTRLNAQVSKGFRLGGINDPLNVPLCTPQDLVTFGGRDAWEDEELWNYEIGTKSTLAGGRATFNVSAYYMDIENLQATLTAGSCSSRVVFNVPEARNTGIEIELAAQPTSRWDLALSASYNDSELRSTVTSTDASGNVSVVAGIEAGNRLPTVPEFQAAAAATYQWPVGKSWLGYVTAVYQYMGSRYTQIGDQAAGFGIVNLNAFAPNTIGGPLTQSTFRFDPELPAYDIGNLRLGMIIDRWDVALFVNNVADERAFLALDQERGTLARVGYLTNQPRTFGISTRVQIR